MQGGIEGMEAGSGKVYKVKSKPVMDLGIAFLNSAITRLSYYKDLADKTFDQLTEAELHIRPGSENNSIAMIVQHMAGNMLSRWTDFLTSDGEKEWRNRDTEFEDQQLTKEQLLAYWQKGWDCCLGSLRSLTADDLLKTIYIRSEGLLAVDAINRQLAHYPYHVGQIIYMGKIIKNKDWQTLSIARGQSAAFNKQMTTKG